MNIIGGGESTFNAGYPATEVAATTAKSISEAPRSPSTFAEGPEMCRGAQDLRRSGGASWTSYPALR